MQANQFALISAWGTAEILIIGGGLLLGLIGLGVLALFSKNPARNLERVWNGDHWGLIHTLVIVYSLTLIFALGLDSQFLPKYAFQAIIGAVMGILGAGLAHGLAKPGSKNGGPPTG